MEESNQFISAHDAFSSSSLITSTGTRPAPLGWQPTESTSNGQYSGDSLTSSTNIISQVEGNRGRHQQGTSTTVSNNSHPTATTEDDDQAMGVIGWSRDDTWSCLAIVFTFWFFVCLFVIMGVYGSVTLILGPHSSILIKPNSYFVEYVKIEELYEGSDGAILLYGFHKDPPLDAVISWSDTHIVSLQSTAHKDWIYFLNEGSQINISYSVNPSTSFPLIFVVAQGYEGLSQWLEDPTYPNTTLSWQLIQGNGTIQEDIFIPSSYYVALGNLNDEAAAVQLIMRLRTLVYNTTEAYDECSFSQGECSVRLSFGSGNTALITSPGPIPGRGVNEWYVKLSYGPRWITYISGIGGITVLMLAAINFWSSCACLDVDGVGRLHLVVGELARSDQQYHHHRIITRRRRTPPPLLIPNKDDDDDLSSWGSSHDCVQSQDHDQRAVLEEGKVEGDENNMNSTRRLCGICYDAPRDCFFLPCGHCVACFTCGSTRIAEAAATCPICGRPLKKVSKIFTV